MLPRRENGKKLLCHDLPQGIQIQSALCNEFTLLFVPCISSAGFKASTAKAVKYLLLISLEATPFGLYSYRSSLILFRVRLNVGPKGVNAWQATHLKVFARQPKDTFYTHSFSWASPFGWVCDTRLAYPLLYYGFYLSTAVVDAVADYEWHLRFGPGQ